MANSMEGTALGTGTLAISTRERGDVPVTLALSWLEMVAGSGTATVSHRADGEGTVTKARSTLEMGTATLPATISMLPQDSRSVPGSIGTELYDIAKLLP